MAKSRSAVLFGSFDHTQRNSKSRDDSSFSITNHAQHFWCYSRPIQPQPAQLAPAIYIGPQTSFPNLPGLCTSPLGSPHAKMPTPESASFLAKKPTVPPTFDGVDYDDNKALKAAQDAIIREQWVKSMMARLVREEMGKCYYREGVNHLEKCGHLRGELTKDPFDLGPRMGYFDKE